MNTKHHSLIGIAICTLLVVGCLLMSGTAISQHKILFGLEGFIVLLFGTLGALFISYPLNSLHVALRVAINAYASKTPSAQDIVDSLLHLSMQSRMEGMLALEEDGERASILFLKRALSMLVDGFSKEELQDALQTEIHFFQKRRAMHERVFRYTARLLIAFGFAGSLIELITLLSNINNAGDIVSNLVITCAPTACGIILAYFVSIPVAENIHTKTQEELLIHKLIAEGVVLIGQEYNILKLQTHLQSFITPHERKIQHMSVKEIRDKYDEFRNSRLDR